MNSIAPLALFLGAGAYLIGKRRGGRPWVYVAASVPISIAIYIATVVAMAYMAQ